MLAVCACPPFKGLCSPSISLVKGTFISSPLERIASLGLLNLMFKQAEGGLDTGSRVGYIFFQSGDEQMDQLLGFQFSSGYYFYWYFYAGIYPLLRADR